MNKLIEAAKAVLGSYDVWLAESGDDVDPQMEALRQAVQEAETYKPMTDDERNGVINRWRDGNADDWEHSRQYLSEVVERIVIERLGLRWPE